MTLHGYSNKRRNLKTLKNTILTVKVQQYFDYKFYVLPMNNKKCNCSGTLASKNQRLGHQSNQKLLHQYQH